MTISEIVVNLFVTQALLYNAGLILGTLPNYIREAKMSLTLASNCQRANKKDRVIEHSAYGH